MQRAEATARFHIQCIEKHLKRWDSKRARNVSARALWLSAGCKCAVLEICGQAGKFVGHGVGFWKLFLGADVALSMDLGASVCVYFVVSRSYYSGDSLIESRRHYKSALFFCFSVQR